MKVKVQGSGMTKRFLVGVAAMPKTFSLSSLHEKIDERVNSALMTRLAKHGILKKIGYGEYTKLSDDPVKDYYDRVRIGGRRKKITVTGVPSPVSVKTTPSVRVVPYDNDTSLIFIGRKIFLGTEVALTPIRKEANS